MLKKDEALLRLIEGQKHRLSRMSKKDKKTKKKKGGIKKEGAMEDTILGDEQSFITLMEQSIVEKEETNLIVQEGMLKGNICDV